MTVEGEVEILKMTEMIHKGHANQWRNNGRVPYIFHCQSVAAILYEAIIEGGEIKDQKEIRDLMLASLGHDLYEDTSISRKEIKEAFGENTDELIFLMTNLKGDNETQDYIKSLSKAPEKVKLIKLSDLTDNLLSCSYGIHDLGIQTVKNKLLPLMSPMYLIMMDSVFTNYPKTGNLLQERCSFAYKRLETNINIYCLGDKKWP